MRRVPRPRQDARVAESARTASVTRRTSGMSRRRDTQDEQGLHGSDDLATHVPYRALRRPAATRETRAAASRAYPRARLASGIRKTGAEQPSTAIPIRASSTSVIRERSERIRFWSGCFGAVYVAGSSPKSRHARSIAECFPEQLL